jgi:hypothetical protein
MKRKVSSADIDLNGRVRRTRTEPATRTMVPAKFIDGPLGGQTLPVQRGADFVNIGPLPDPFFVYSYAGKEGQTRLYAIWPNQRKLRKLLMFSIGKYGRDPRAVHAANLSTPTKRTEPSKHGQGARRRAAKHVAA